MSDWKTGTGFFGNLNVSPTQSVNSCNCLGPRNGEPYCACRMKGIIERDGRWIEPERDLGPVVRRRASALDGLNASIRKGT